MLLVQWVEFNISKKKTGGGEVMSNPMKPSKQAHKRSALGGDAIETSVSFIPIISGTWDISNQLSLIENIFQWSFENFADNTFFHVHQHCLKWNFIPNCWGECYIITPLWPLSTTHCYQPSAGGNAGVSAMIKSKECHDAWCTSEQAVRKCN